MVTKEQIKEARTAAGLTQTEAAKKIHVTCRCWQRWEEGSRKMPLASWELFCIKTKTKVKT